MDSKSKNPVQDMVFVFQLQQLLKKIQPDILLNYTAKPNIYGTFAAKMNGIPCINNIAGLGFGFVAESATTKILSLLYRLSQRRADKVFFQNPDDFAEFKRKNLVQDFNADLLPGSGVDLKRFAYNPLEKEDSSPFIFLFIGRLLYSKGVNILFDASKKIYESENKSFKVILVGESNVNNQDAIPNDMIEKWNKENFFNYIGKTDNVYDVIKKSHCVVLPSYYREGTPRSVLEGLSTGRPIITTKMPGCKTTVKDGYNGYLINPKDTDDLAEKMLTLINMSILQLKEFGNNSRKMAEEKFDEHIVINKYLKTIKELT